MIFYLNGQYLLTDYQAPYSFTLPTPDWADGAYVLSATARMRDGFTTSQASVSIKIANGATSSQANTQVFQPTSGKPAENGKPFVVVAAGDGASGEISSERVVKLIGSLDPNLFLYLGDVYEKGSVAEFFNWYGNQGTGFDSLRSITDPTIGNHEYTSGTSQGYFDYWNNVPNYYSFNADGWHFISLNANSSYVPVDPSSSQYEWLAADLSANAGACTIAFYHQPVFNIGPEGSASYMMGIWSLLAKNGVSIVLNGHDHDYQRWVPLDAQGQPSLTGITEFIAGGGGHGLQTIPNTDSRVAFSDDMNPTTFGALKLILNPTGANFSYIGNDGATLDSGVIPCAKTGADTQAPTAPTGLSVTPPAGATQVNLAWQASSDNTGIQGYTVYRNQVFLAKVLGSTLSYTDDTVLPQTTYAYTIDAFDPAGNNSPIAGPASVTTPAMPASMTFTADADTYINQSSPSANYGTAMTLRLDKKPDVHAYLRFTVKGLAGTPITRARLLVYTNDSSNLGISVQTVVDNTWDEYKMVFTNAPALGSALASSGPIAANSWVTIDITPYITGEGIYSIGVSSLGSSALSLQSRETGANAPQLILDLKP